MSGSERKRIVSLYIVIALLICFVNTPYVAEAVNYTNAEEKDGKLVNISPVLSHARYTNGYLFSDANLYQKKDGFWFSVGVKNVAEKKRKSTFLTIQLLDKNNAKVYIQNSIKINTLQVGESERIHFEGGDDISAEEVEVIIEDCYDFAVGFDEADLLNPDQYIVFNKDVTCNKSGEILENEDVTLTCEYTGENATYQWFSGDKVTAAGDVIKGADERTYTIRDVTSEELEKFYYCRIWNEDRVVNSRWYRLKEFVTISATEEALPKEEIPEEQEETENPLEEWSLLRQPSGLKKEFLENGSVHLRWDNGETIAERIFVLRSQKEDAGYKIVKRLEGSKEDYTDKKVEIGKTYFYKVLLDRGESTEEAVLAFKATPVKVLVDYLIQPVILVKKNKSNGQKYIQIALRKYAGKYIEIYMKDTGKYKKLAIKKKMNLTEKITYRFRYVKSGATLSFKARTYQKIAGKKVYSKYSKAVKITL